MTLFQYLILFFAVFIGGGIAMYFRKQNTSYLNLMLSFSGAYLIGIAVLHLLPAAYYNSDHKTGLFILAGFFVQLLLEQLSKGVEHGHIHPHDHGGNSYVIQVMIGLCLHAFLEGLPLGNETLFQHIHEGHNHSHDNLLVGIILHKAPAAFALAALLIASKYKNHVVAICLFIFASMSPLGSALAEFLGQTGLINVEVEGLIMAFVVGSFLHIATTILFETESGGDHQLPIKKILSIAIGLCLAIFTSL